MTVSELITRLQALPQDLPVVWNYDNYTYDAPHEPQVETVSADMRVFGEEPSVDVVLLNP